MYSSIPLSTSFPTIFIQLLHSSQIHIEFHSLNAFISSALRHFPFMHRSDQRIRNSASDNEKTFAPVWSDKKIEFQMKKGCQWLLLFISFWKIGYQKKKKCKTKPINHSKCLSFRNFIWYRKRWCSDVKWHFFNPFTCFFCCYSPSNLLWTDFEDWMLVILCKYL